MLNAESSNEYRLLGWGGENALKKRMVREPDRQLKDVDISILITSVIF